MTTVCGRESNGRTIEIKSAYCKSNCWYDVQFVNEVWLVSFTDCDSGFFDMTGVDSTYDESLSFSRPLAISLGVADCIDEAVVPEALVGIHIFGYTSNAMCLHRESVFFIHYCLLKHTHSAA